MLSVVWLVGAGMLVLTSCLVWVFQDRGAMAIPSTDPRPGPELATAGG